MEGTDIISLLHAEGGSCVICKGAETRIYRRRGVIDLFELYEGDPGFMHGARLADKVIGKGAAALVALGGMAEVYADLISTPALTVLRQAGNSHPFRPGGALHHQPEEGWQVPLGDGLRQPGHSRRDAACHPCLRGKDEELSSLISHYTCSPRSKGSPSADRGPGALRPVRGESVASVRPPVQPRLLSAEVYACRKVVLAHPVPLRSRCL